ncbi:hypothetical protein ACSS7Z_01240 [Microbacterium sp. A82]|uniref:hypothetical protein n=1 Tax=Microbacterium sp. A82 TaxID=3450452 RepID=UPI003F2D3C81
MPQDESNGSQWCGVGGECGDSRQALVVDSWGDSGLASSSRAARAGASEVMVA